MLRAMQKKTGTRVTSEEAEKFFLEHSGDLSGADIEAVLIRARMKSVLENDAVMDVDDLKSALSLEVWREAYRPRRHNPRGADGLREIAAG